MTVAALNFPVDTPTTNARLAAAVALFILSEEELQASHVEHGYFPLTKFAARYEAFQNLKTVFETEFPHVEN